MLRLKDQLYVDWGHDSGHCLVAILLAVLTYGAHNGIGSALVGGVMMGAIALGLARMQWYICLAIFVQVFLMILLVPSGPLWAAFVGGFGYMVPKEIGDMLRGGYKVDNLSDAYSYQVGCWPLMAWLYVDHIQGALVFVALGISYFALIWGKAVWGKGK